MSFPSFPISVWLAEGDATEEVRRHGLHHESAGGKSTQRILARWHSPSHAFACAVPVKFNERGLVMAVEAFDGVVEAAFGVLVGVGREGVVDAGWPVFFFEGGEDGFLVGAGNAVLLDDVVAVEERTAGGVPMGLVVRRTVGGDRGKIDGRVGGRRTGGRGERRRRRRRERRRGCRPRE